MTDDPPSASNAPAATCSPPAHAVTFAAVAAHAGISRATLYRRPDLRAIIEEHRRHAAATRSPSPAWPSRSTSSAAPSKPSPPRSAATKNNSENSTASTEPTSRPHPRPYTKISTD